MRTVLTNIPRRVTLGACAMLFALIAFGVTSQQRASAQSGRQSKENKSSAQSAPTPAPLIKRTTTRREVRRLGFGGSVTVYGAPEGSVTVEGWSRSEVEITAEVEQSADTEENLARLAALNTFLLDEDINHLSVLTVGLHDRKYAKRVARDLPKNLPAMPWKIDFHLKVPAMTDLEINAGRGALVVSGVEGALRINAGGGGASQLTLTGGDVEATVTKGPVTVRVPSRNWRGRGMNVRVAGGDLEVQLAAGFSGDVDAEVLRAGRVENGFAGLEPRERSKPTERSLQARAGAGGAPLTFTVGDGTLRISQANAKP
jgi:hypothetical protein